MAVRDLHLDGVRTPLREAGPPEEREAVVFVHGNPGSGADWEHLLEVAAAAGRRALAWDAPGFGRSAAPGFVQSVGAHAAFIGRVLDVLGVDRAVLVLHDFGGPWGLEWAAGAPERLAGAVLIGTGVLPGYRGHAAAHVWRTPLLGEAVMAATTRRAFHAVLGRGRPRALPPGFLDRMYDDFDRRTRRAVLDLYRSVPGTNAEAQIAALRPYDLPALVLWGAHDPYLPAHLAERQRDAFPSAEVEVLDESGHWPFVDAAGVVADRLARFLAGVGRSAARPRPAPLGGTGIETVPAKTPFVADRLRAPAERR